MRTQQIQYVNENTIVRLPDGRLGIAPNRGERGRYHVRVQHPTEENFAVVLKGTDVVEEVELAINIVWERLREMNRQAAAPEMLQWMEDEARLYEGMAAEEFSPETARRISALRTIITKAKGESDR